MAASENIHWEGVDYEAANLDIQSETYRPKDPEYFLAGRTFDAQEGRVMADVAIDWVAKKMQSMMDG